MVLKFLGLPLCDGDDDFLGNRNPAYKSNWENTSTIVKTADQLGYRNVLCPSSYQVGQDTLAFVAGMAPLTEQINLFGGNTLRRSASSHVSQKHCHLRSYASRAANHQHHLL